MGKAQALDQDDDNDNFHDKRGEALHTLFHKTPCRAQTQVLCPIHKLQASVDHPVKRDEQIILGQIRSPDCRNGFTSFVPAAKWHIWYHPAWAERAWHQFSQALLRWQSGLISGVNIWAWGSKHCIGQLSHTVSRGRGNLFPLPEQRE